ncbi:MAG: orotate phosphoribosyltransferase [Cyanobacteria bacterium P01_A01_bin.114]
MTQPTDISTLDLTTATAADTRSALLDLICTKAYKEGDFALSSGKRSPYYINCKQVTLHPQGGLMVGQALLDRLPIGTVGVGGLTLGADPIVTAVSIVGAYQGKPVTPLIVRKEAKGHGTQAYIEGPALPDESPVVVLEDVVTTGQSAFKAIERLREAGYQVNQVLSLVDRQEGGAALYAEKGLIFDSVYTIADIQARWKALAIT